MEQRTLGEYMLIEKIHPTLGIKLRSDGQVFIPESGSNKGHWTQGFRNGPNPKCQYRSVQINKKQYKVHRLMAETFLEREEGKNYVDHIDRNSLNNDISNLRWVTARENLLNRSTHEQSLEKYGVTPSDNLKEYRRRRNRVYRAERRLKLTLTIEVF